MHADWFKSLKCYNYECSEDLSLEQWEEGFKSNAHIPILPTHIESVGFSPVFGFQAPDLMSCVIDNRFILFSLTVESKKLPKTKMFRMHAQRKRELAKKEGIKEEDIHKEESEALLDQIKAELCKDAAADEMYTNAFLDTKERNLYIDTCSPKKIRRLLEWIKRIDEGFKTKEIFQASLELYLTQWLHIANEIPEGITLEKEAVLKHTDKSTAAFRNQELESTEVKTLINHDKKVVDLAICKDNRLIFNLRKDGTLRKIVATETLEESISYPENNTVIDRMETNCRVMITELSDLVSWMLNTFQVNAISTGVTSQVEEANSNLDAINSEAAG